MRIKGWLCHACEFVECRFSGVIRDVVFFGRQWGPDWDGRVVNEYRNNDFSGARFEWVGFRGEVDLRAQRLPTDERWVYVRDAEERLDAARVAVLRWPDLEERKLGLEMLDFLGGAHMGGLDGQQDLFVERQGLPSYVPRQVSDQVWPLLETSTRG